MVNSWRICRRTYFIFIKTRHNFTGRNQASPGVTFDVSPRPSSAAAKLISRELRTGSLALGRHKFVVIFFPPVITLVRARSWNHAIAPPIDRPSASCLLSSPFLLLAASSKLSFFGRRNLDGTLSANERAAQRDPRTTIKARRI